MKMRAIRFVGLGILVLFMASCQQLLDLFGLGGSETITLSGTVTLDSGVTSSGNIRVGVLDSIPSDWSATITYVDITGNPTVKPYAQSFSFSFAGLAKGSYFVGAFVDTNNDGKIGATEASGVYPVTSTGTAWLESYSADTSGIAITIKQPAAAANSSPAAPGPYTPASGAVDIALTPTLTWAAATDVDGDRVSYDVYLDSSSSPTTKLTTSAVTALSYTIGSGVLASGTKYYWKVQALDGNGGATDSAVRSFTTLSSQNSAPTAPTLSAPADASTGSSLTPSFSWTASTDLDGDSVSYDLYLDGNTPPTTKQTGAALTSLSHTLGSGILANGATYHWKVRAFDGNGGIADSAIRSFTTVAAATGNSNPAAPTLSSPANNGTDMALTPPLFWGAVSDPDGDTVSYDVYLDTNPAPTTKLTASPGSLPLYNVGTGVLASGTKYYWKIRALDGKNGYADSAIWSFTTAAAANANPSAPVLASPVNAATGVALAPMLMWTASTDADNDSLSYDVYLDTTSSPTMKLNGTTVIAATSFTPGTNLLNSTTYYWKVQAKDGKGGTADSSIGTFTTLAAVTGPTVGSLPGLSPTGVRKGQLLVNPALPTLLTYLYISASGQLYSVSSSDRGLNWGTATPASGGGMAIDFAGEMDDVGNTIALFVTASDDSGTAGTASWTELPSDSSTWTAKTDAHTAATPGCVREPSVSRSGGKILLGFGYDSAGGAVGDDTNAKSLYWSGGVMSAAKTVGLYSGTDNPTGGHQVYLGSDGMEYYIYPDCHPGTTGGDWYSTDLWTISGNAVGNWAGETSEVVVADVTSPGGDWREANQGHLFKVPGGDYVLVYVNLLRSTSGGELFFKHASTVGGLSVATPISMGSPVMNAADANARYRTVCATQGAAGDIQVAWQTATAASNSNTWRKINASDYSLGNSLTVTTDSDLDGISVSSAAVYVSTRFGAGKTVSVLPILNY